MSSSSAATSPPQAGSHFTSLQAAMASSLKDSTEQNH